MWVYQRVDEFRDMPICHLNKSGIVISDLLKMIVAYRFIFFAKRFIHHLGNPLGRCLQTLEVPGSTNPSGWWSISDFQTWRWWSQSMKLLVYYRMYWNYRLAAASQKTFTNLDPPSRHSAALEWWGIHYWDWSIDFKVSELQPKTDRSSGIICTRSSNWWRQAALPPPVSTSAMSHTSSLPFFPKTSPVSSPTHQSITGNQVVDIWSQELWQWWRVTSWKSTWLGGSIETSVSVTCMYYMYTNQRDKHVGLIIIPIISISVSILYRYLYLYLIHIYI